MNQRPALGWVALLIALGSAIAVVLLMSGLPIEAYAAAPQAAAADSGHPSWLLTGLAVVLWVALKRGG